jgi:hypothetical protein
MSTSAHLGIRDAVAALFAGLAASLHENATKPLPTGVATQIDVRRERSVPSQATTSFPIDWDTELEISILGRSEAEVDDLCCSVFAAVMADQQLGGLCEYIEPGEFAWDQEQAEKTVHRATWRITVRHTTNSNVIT